MLVPPEVDYLKKAGSGKSRQFTNKTMAPEDLDPSGWTETPAEKQRRLEEQRLGKRKAVADQDTGPSQLDIQRHRNVQQYNVSFNADKDDDFFIDTCYPDANKTIDIVGNASTKKEEG